MNNARTWLLHVAAIVVGGLIVAYIVSLIAKKQLDDATDNNALLGLFKKR